MSSAVASLPITAAEYLEGELKSGVRHEFVDGRVYAMSGASRKHNQICLDTAMPLIEHLRGGPCQTFVESVKVQIADDLGEIYYYPDVVVTCEPGDDDSHFVKHPKLVVEVISESTSRHDRGDKLEGYKRNPAVEEIVHIERDWPEVRVYRRSDSWKKHIYTQPGSQVPLLSIDFSILVSDFYRSNPFPEDVRRPWYLTNREDG